MKRDPRFWAGVFLLVFLVFIMTFASLRLGNPPVLLVQIAEMPASLDPGRVSCYEEKLISGNIYETLLEFDPQQQKAHGCLAEKWVVDQDGCVYTFFLRQRVRFHNGSCLTADDVKFSWERLVEPGSEYSYLLANILGAEEKLQGIAQEVKGIKVVNPRVLQVVLKEPDFTFPALVSSPALAIVNAQVVKKLGNSYGRKGTPVVGTGPYQVCSWERDRIVLCQNNRYHGKRPSSQRIHFLRVAEFRTIERFLRTGKLDVVTGISAQEAHKLQQDDGLKILKKPVLSTFFLGFRSDQSPFGSNSLLRKAVTAAVDRGSLLEKLLGEGGRELTGFFPPELLPEDQNAGREVEENQTGPLKYLAQAGHPYGADLPPLVFTYNKSFGHVALARLFQEQMGEVGIDVRLQELPWEEFRSGLQEGKFTFFRAGWDADYPEAGSFLHYYCLFSKQKLPAIEELFQKARCEKDPLKRSEMYRKAEQLILDNAFVVPLFQKVMVFAFREEVTGLDVDLLGRVDFRSVSKSIW
jgi:peptide/nickel transport system substrate-binding protein/oligopeptide transport system substrate-binding protein